MWVYDMIYRREKNGEYHLGQENDKGHQHQISEAKKGGEHRKEARHCAFSLGSNLLPQTLTPHWEQLEKDAGNLNNTRTQALVSRNRLVSFESDITSLQWSL